MSGTYFSNDSEKLYRKKDKVTKIRQLWQNVNYLTLTMQNMGERYTKPNSK